jgi:hypothetical protein
MKPAMVLGKSRIDDAKIGGMTPEVLIFSGGELSPPYYDDRRCVSQPARNPPLTALHEMIAATTPTWSATQGERRPEIALADELGVAVIAAGGLATIPAK